MFIDNSVGWVHTDFNFRPPQGQIASRNPNVQNASKHTRLGQLFRRGVRAPKGYVLLEGDYVSFHASILAFLANDPKYNRLATLDPHSIYLSSMIQRVREDKKLLEILHKSGMDMTFVEDELITPIDFSVETDVEILKKAKYIKNTYKHIRTKVAKPTVLGNQLLMTAKTLMLQNKKYIKSMRMAEALQKTIEDDYPIQHRYKEQLPRYYYDNGITIAYNAFGRCQRFYDLYVRSTNRYTGMKEERLGDSARKLLAFFVQSTAFGHKTQTILEHCDQECIDAGRHLKDCGCLPVRLRWINDIHDANLCIVPENDVEIYGKLLKNMMESTSSVLKSTLYPNGYLCKGEYEWGVNWGAQKFEGLPDNPDGMRELKIAA